MRLRPLPTALLLPLLAGAALADPCGMVPPVVIEAGGPPPIERIGVQKTYVFYKDGVESFAIRPGFRGDVEEFGMLIPFPTPPAIKKLPDDFFSHLAAACDPPEVVIDHGFQEGAGGVLTFDDEEEGPLMVDEVRVLRQEAVGMYEVAVLEAGSAAALKRWMDDHGYHYPEGMDAATDDYVAQGWCFVAVKTRVTGKKTVAPEPGMGTLEFDDEEPGLPEDAGFSGHVQAMGFRFASEELVVPMRLSAFNAGELRNVIFLLGPEPLKVKDLPDAFVRRQVPGAELRRNLTELLAARLVGVALADLDPAELAERAPERDPATANGHARDLFAADLLAVREGRLANPHEELEKALLAVDERLGLRGEDVDAARRAALTEERDRVAAAALDDLAGMTLTVIDGDFPRELLAEQDLRFEPYALPAERNRREVYDAKVLGEPEPPEGVRVELPPGGAADPRGCALGVGPRATPPLGAALLALLALGLRAARRREVRV